MYDAELLYVVPVVDNIDQLETFNFGQNDDDEQFCNSEWFCRLKEDPVSRSRQRQNTEPE